MQGWFIDQKKLLKYLENKFSVSKAFFYYGKDSKSIKKEKFLKKLTEFGYILRVKEIKRYGNKSKANCDVGLTMDVLLEIRNYKQVVVISSPKSTAREIRKIVGDEHIDFGSLRFLIEYKKRGRP